LHKSFLDKKSGTRFTVPQGIARTIPAAFQPGAKSPVQIMLLLYDKYLYLSTVFKYFFLFPPLLWKWSCG